MQEKFPNISGINCMCERKEGKSHRVHEEDSVGRSVEDTVGVLIASELKAEGVSDTSLQTHRLRRDHKPGASTSNTQLTVSDCVCVSLTVCVCECV